MKNYDVLDGNIISLVSELHKAFDLGYEQGLRDGQEGMFTKLDVEEAYTQGYCEGKKSEKEACERQHTTSTRKEKDFIRELCNILKG